LLPPKQADKAVAKGNPRRLSPAVFSWALSFEKTHYTPKSGYQIDTGDEAQVAYAFIRNS